MSPMQRAMLAELLIARRVVAALATLAVVVPPNTPSTMPRRAS